MTVYVGLDVHRKRTQVAILDEEVGELLNRNVPNDPAEFIAILGSLDAGTSVAFEAAYGWDGWPSSSRNWDRMHISPTLPAARPSRRRD